MLDFQVDMTGTIALVSTGSPSHDDVHDVDVGKDLEGELLNLDSICKPTQVVHICDAFLGCLSFTPCFLFGVPQSHMIYLVQCG